MKESKKGFIVTNSKNEVIGFMESYDLIEGKTYKNSNLYRYYKNIEDPMSDCIEIDSSSIKMFEIDVFDDFDISCDLTPKFTVVRQIPMKEIIQYILDNQDRLTKHEDVDIKDISSKIVYRNSIGKYNNYK